MKFNEKIILMRISLLDSYKRVLAAFQLKLKFLEGLSHSATNAFCHSARFVILNEVKNLHSMMNSRCG